MPRATPTPAPSVIVVTLTDQNNRHPKDIPVRFTAAGKSATVRTDDRGKVRINGPGRFRIDVVQGCHPRVRVTGGGFANVSALPQSEKPVELPVQWEHRIGPGPPVHPDRGGSWPVGEDTALTFAVIDRCAKDRAPGGSFETFAFKTNPVLKVVTEPEPKADGEGRASVVVRCVREGEPSVIAIDETNPSDSFDMAQESTGVTKPRCS